MFMASACRADGRSRLSLDAVFPCPKAGHRQLVLSRYEHREGLVYGRTFDMPAGAAREMSVIVRVGGHSYFPKAEIKSFGKQNVQQANLIAARHSSSQIGKGIRESDVSINLQKNAVIRAGDILR